MRRREVTERDRSLAGRPARGALARGAGLRGAAIAAIALVIAAAATEAAASPAQDLEQARQAFRQHDYDSARKLATFLLYPDEKLALPVDLVEAHVILGASNFESGHRIEAKTEFEKALQIQPDKSLTDLLFSEGAIRLFDETKADIEARAERDAQLRKLADERERIRKYKESLVVVERHSFGINFAPFGAGQFQNKQPVRGVLFAAGEGITGGISVTIFLYLSGKYGLNAKVPPVDAQGVRQLQQLEIATGVGFFAIYAWGVVDALLHYKPRVQIEGDDSLLPPARDVPSDPAKKPPARKTSALDRLHLRPMIAPTGASIGLSWEND
jgi:tetratricopeptide (TPR) repeat protein